MQTHRHINWPNSIFLTLTPLVGIVGTILLALYGAITWQTIVLTLLLVIVTGLSITCGYHRLFAHKAYQAKGPVRFFFALFGAGAFEGSILEWCTDHRDHHRYTDTEKDPYNIKQGFWYAHMTWLFTLDTNKRDFSNIADLQADPLVALQHKYYLFFAFFMGFGFPVLVASLWGDWLGGLIIAGALRITICQQGTFCINSVCHYFGKKTYSKHESARDHWFTALFTFGEGYHNFHHKFPLDYRNGIRSYDFDPSKWLIRTLAYLGLASDLKTINAHRIIQCRLQTEEQHLLANIENCDKLKARLHHLIEPAREAVLTTLGKLETLEKTYREHAFDRKHLLEYKTRLKQYKRDLKESLFSWSRLMKESDG